MDGLLLPIIYVVAFVAVVLLIQALANAYFSRGDTVQRVNRRLTMLESGMRPDEVYATLVRNRGGPLRPDVPGLAGMMDRFRIHVRQSGLNLSPIRILIYAGGAAFVLWVVALVFFASSQGGNFLLNALLSFVGAAGLALLGAWVFVDGRRTARLKQLEQQLPLALDIVTRAIRAGHPVVSAVQLAAHEMGDPIGSEFGLIVDETTYGMEFKDALVSFARRTGSPDAHFFAVSVGIQSETGGNLAEILEGLASVIRGRMTLAQRVKALSSEGRASAMILSGLPIFLIGSIALSRPAFYTDKFSDPIFWPTALIVAGVYALGQFILSRITTIRY